MRNQQQQAALVANIIAAFLDGTGGERDWDDFTSLRQRDKMLEDIRKRALAVYLPIDHDGEVILRGLQNEAEHIARGDH